MSSIQELKNGFRAQVAIKGQRASETFATKNDAKAWAAKKETEFRAAASGKTDKTKTLRDAFTRYSEEISTTRKGWKWEQTRLAAFGRTDGQRTGLPLSLRLVAVTPAHIAQWRDARLGEVKAGTVLRELGLLGGVFEVARREWGWIEGNPVRDIKGPASPQHRERVISRREIKAMLRSLDYRPGRPTMSMTGIVALIFLAALRTGMRSGELTALKWADYAGTYARLHTSKTGPGRDVPVSAKARRIFAMAQAADPDTVFPVSASTRDTIFRRAKTRAGLSGFTFHDARHTAATWIATGGKLTLMELCKMFGWRDPKHALIYFNPTATDLAGKLD